MSGRGKGRVRPANRGRGSGTRGRGAGTRGRGTGSRGRGSAGHGNETAVTTHNQESEPPIDGPSQTHGVQDNADVSSTAVPGVTVGSASVIDGE